MFGIAPLRNLMSLAFSGKKDFTSLIGLENKNEQKEKKQAQEKATGLIKTLAAVSAAGLAATLGFLQEAKNKNFYKTVEPYLDKFLKHLDFTKDCDLRLAHYGALIYPASIAGYFYASRDKYERLENARRFSITVPLMLIAAAVALLNKIATRHEFERDRALQEKNTQ